MRHRYHRKHGGAPPSIDQAFSDALTESHTGHFHRTKENHKAKQMCRQVQRALSLALSGEMGDDVLRELYVMDVTPAPNAARLFVHVIAPRHIGISEMLERLDRATPRLRAEIAGAITRKKVPELTFIPAALGEAQQ